MERFIGSVLAFPASPDLTPAEYNKDLKTLNDILAKLSAQALVGTRDSDPLELLDNRANSLGILYAFFARLSVDKNEIHQLWPKLIDFFSEFDGKQIKFSKDQLLAVLKVLLQFCDACNKPILALKPLEHTITQLNYSTGARTFSSLHTKFVKKCLDARSYRAALPILDIDIEEFPVKGSDKDVTYREVLQYFLYGAMIYMATKKWRRASDFLQFVLSYPAIGTTVSQIQVDAFKKFVLVTLMLEGRNFQLPKTIPQSTARACRIVGRPYEAFATAYATGNPDILRREAALVKEVFQTDGNWGIAEQCLENFRRLGIKALTSTYSTLSIEAIASRDLDVLGSRASTISPEELERYILDMIDRKEIKASLSHSSTNDGSTSCMVSFHDLPASETDILKDLEAQIARTVQITNQARQLDKKLGLSKEWINFTSKKRGGPGGANDHVDQGFEEMDDYPIQGRGGIIDMAAIAGMVGGVETQGFHDYMGAYDPADDDMQPDYDD
ncbi:hypothetical protein TWF788_009145 [Orbilia oligospora]|uniref:COP9 signalosome complex subunit 3 n=1 Tax=Orbilia oligospora TaxID=2813651 RepID=A0A6G1M9Z8_ORBOL|nr:hypothetical protein TWF788_009145 [Orbilia oligospora]KAF3202421.1 hypothetical protein TWF679_010816 [Orbilia oligospora]KAF3205230.1 hypothetical protein TWF191_001938 [Orbilia oligospora]KAF3251005.1 hypothetical protein TWF192_004984 [Orbilia oligospora]